MKKLIILFFSILSLSAFGQVKISDMPAATSLTGTELIPIVQGGINKKATVALWPYWNNSSINTNSGLKTFLYGTLGLRNVANTFTSQFTNTNSAARTYTLPDFSGNILATGGTTTMSGNFVLDASASHYSAVFGAVNEMGGFAANVSDDVATNNILLQRLNVGSLNFDRTSGMILTDVRGTKKGLQYAASGYVTDPLSLATKEYVDAAGFTVASYYAPTTIVANATDANFTATVNGVHNILDGVASANRVITIPTGANGDVMKFYNTEDTRVWSFTGATVYLADRVTVQTELLYNVPCHMEKIAGIWIITN